MRNGTRSQAKELIDMNISRTEDHGVVVRAFGLYWDSIRLETLSTHHSCALSKSFIPRLVVWSVTQNNAFGGEKKNKEQR